METCLGKNSEEYCIKTGGSRWNAEIKHLGNAPGNEDDMKGSFLWKLMWLLCILTGILAGYGIFRITDAQEIKPNTQTKDNTLLQNNEDSVFFDGITTTPAETLERRPETEKEEKNEQKEESAEAEFPELEQEKAVSPVPTIAPPDHTTAEAEYGLETDYDGKESITAETDDIGNVEIVVTMENGSGLQGQKEGLSGKKLPALSELLLEHEPYGKDSVWQGSHIRMEAPMAVPEDDKTTKASQSMPDYQEQDETFMTISDQQEAETRASEVITYPVEIFGQVPVINRSDRYASYFEFCYDVVSLVEEQVEQRGMSMNVLMTRFAVKALFCGVDVKQLDINAPIARKDAALVLWLAAQLLEEKGNATSAKTAGQYVTDISGCSNSVKKAVAYLYEQGIIPGYQVAGQQFQPEAKLQTESSAGWLSKVKQCWK